MRGNRVLGSLRLLGDHDVEPQLHRSAAGGGEIFLFFFRAEGNNGGALLMRWREEEERRERAGTFRVMRQRGEEGMFLRERLAASRMRWEDV